METLKELNVEKVSWYKQKKYWVVSFIVIALFLWVNSMDAAIQEVKGSNIFTGLVKQGNMEFKVSGTGILVPVDIRLISANSASLVEKVEVLPGAKVAADTVIARLSNPEIRKGYDEAKLLLELEEAKINALRRQYENEYLDQQARVSKAKVDYRISKLQMESEEKLISNNIVSQLNYKRTKLETEQLFELLEIERKRLKHLKPLHEAQLIAAEAQLAVVRRALDLQRELVDSLDVRAGINGILQVMNFDQGQSVKVGDVIAEVANQEKLKGEIKVSESQARFLQLGQPVNLKAGKSLLNGQISRIDPAVLNGTITVDVELLGDLGGDVRPNLRVSGVVDVDKLNNVLYVGRPTQNVTGGISNIYVIDEDNIARLRKVTFGRESADSIEILSGLIRGDKVVLSDMSNLNGEESFKIAN